MARPTSDHSPKALPDEAQVRSVQDLLLTWYREQGRDLPWRQTRDPYAVLLSEVMLQQTQVDRVIPKWRGWLERFPTLADLASAPRGEVIRAWSGLGYNLRAVRLHEVAQQAVERFGGHLPSTLEELLALKGLGRYTAGAVACFAFGQSVSVVDTNVRRVLGRVFLGQPETGLDQERQVQQLADRVLPLDDAYAWNQGVMDLGATRCTAAKPACLVCPLLSVCQAAPLMGTWREERKQVLRERRSAYAVAPVEPPPAAPGLPRPTSAKVSPVSGPDAQRIVRGRVVAALRGLSNGEALSLVEIQRRLEEEGLPTDLVWLERLVRKLADNGLAAIQTESTKPEALRLRLP